MTIHGSHGVLVQDNVAYDTYGHCYFTEDGGEKDTTFNGNLGLSTREGIVTPSDKEVTSVHGIMNIYFDISEPCC